MGGQRSKEEEPEEQIRQKDRGYRGLGTQGRRPEPRHYQREEGQESFQVHAEGPSVPVHERGSARAQVENADGTRVVDFDREFHAFMSDSGVSNRR